MPRVALTVTDYSSTLGSAKTAVAVAAETTGDAANDHTMANDGRTWLEARNAGAVSRTLEVEFSKTVNGQTITKHSYALAAGDTVRIGPWETELYGSVVNVNVDSSDLRLRASKYTVR